VERGGDCWGGNPHAFKTSKVQSFPARKFLVNPFCFFLPQPIEFSGTMEIQEESFQTSLNEPDSANVRAQAADIESVFEPYFRSRFPGF